MSVNIYLTNLQMKLQEIRDDYEELSAKASDLNRKLIYSGIAIIWLFHFNFDVSTINNNVDVIPKTLHLPLLLFCVSLGVELFQLFFSTVVWYLYYCWKRQGCKDESKLEVNEPELFNIIPWIAWMLKIVLTIWGYIELANFLGFSFLSIKIF